MFRQRDRMLSPQTPRFPAAQILFESLSNEAVQPPWQPNWDELVLPKGMRLAFVAILLAVATGLGQCPITCAELNCVITNANDQVVPSPPVGTYTTTSKDVVQVLTRDDHLLKDQPVIQCLLHNRHQGSVLSLQKLPLQSLGDHSHLNNLQHSQQIQERY